MLLQPKYAVRSSLFLAILYTFVSVSFSAELFDPPALYLTWQRDPTTTMTVQWHTTNKAPSLVEWRGLAGGKWNQVCGASHVLAESNQERWVHTAEIIGLTPDTSYQFRFGEGSREFKFRTMPADLSKPVKFIQGGDTYHQKDWMDHMNRLAAKQDPTFILIGGDLAYGNDMTNTVEKVQRWYDFFASWKKHVVAPDGRVIPLVVIIGNHEVKGFWHKPNESAPVFYSAFCMPGTNGYACLDFGKYLSLLLLDSGHTHPVAGAQTEWLEEKLIERRSVPHVFPVYHVAAYPSARKMTTGENSDIGQSIRKLWMPLFEENGIKLAFEYHDHTFKRTHPIRAGKVDPEGVVYIGDGAWGVRLRTPHPVEKTWYLAKAGAIRHFFVITLTPEKRHVIAMNDKEEVFDEFEQSTAKPKTAQARGGRATVPK